MYAGDEAPVRGAQGSLCVVGEERSLEERRRFLAAMAASACLLPAGGALASVGGENKRRLWIRNAHTDEVADAIFWRDGGYELDALTTVNRLFRDRRTGEVLPIDVRLVELLSTLQAETGTKAPIDVISGYRSPKSNQLLRRRSRGVARNSLHMHGMAADIRIPDKKLRAVHKLAVSLKAGGVGYYRRSGFLHVDVGKVRYWG